MAELSKGGSATGAVTGSASTAPNASARGSGRGGRGWIASRMAARCSSTDLTAGPPPPRLPASQPGPLPLLDELAQPGQELVGQVGAVTGELHDRTQVVELVAGV